MVNTCILSYIEVDGLQVIRMQSIQVVWFQCKKSNILYFNKFNSEKNGRAITLFRFLYAFVKKVKGY